MFKKQLFFILLLVLPTSALAQSGSLESTAPSDTICFKVEQANLIKQKVQKLQHRDSLNTEIIKELRFQVIRLEEKTQSLEKEVRLTEKQLRLYKKEMEYTKIEEVRQDAETKKWFYTAGGVAGGFLLSLLF